MTNVISYALFRSPSSRFERPEAGAYRGRFFAAHLPLVLRASAANFPGWQVRIHHDESIWHVEYGGVLLRLADQGAIKLVDMGKCTSLCGSMLWRMAPAWDPEVEHFICRDLDSVVSPRERRVVQEWVDSGMAAHAIHDHPYHAGTALMGGMVGFDAKQFRKLTGLKDLVDLYAKAPGSLDQHGSDQRLLNALIWPRVQKHALMHQLRSDQNENAGKTLFKVQVTSPERWMGQDKGLAIFKGPHIGAVFTEYEGDVYRGPTFKPEVVAERLGKALDFYEREDWDGPYVDVRATIREAEQFAGIDMAKLIRAGARECRAVFSCDLHENYAFFLPITARLWRDVVGYTPVALLVGTPEQWNTGMYRIALHELRALGTEVFFIPSMEGHRDSTVAQVSRLYGGCLPFKDDAYLLTGDVDMLPLSPGFFKSVDHARPLHIFFANAYMVDVGDGRLEPEGRYPICYIGASTAGWRKVMKLGERPDLKESIRLQLDDGLGRNAASDASWHYDEVLLGIRIRESGMLAEAQLRHRAGQPPIDRIDRGCWDQAPSIDKAVECHALRPAQHADHWPKLQPIIQAKLGAAGLDWANRYRDCYVGATAAGVPVA